MKTICNISRFIGEIFVFVGKFGLFVYFVLRMLLILYICCNLKYLI